MSGIQGECAEPHSGQADAAVLMAAQARDRAAFGALAEPYRRQLHVYCYRMLGSFMVPNA